VFGVDAGDEASDCNAFLKQFLPPERLNYSLLPVDYLQALKTSQISLDEAYSYSECPSIDNLCNLLS